MSETNLTLQGTLRDGTAIAVKVLSLHSRQGAKEFLNELLAISDVTHENLVKLYGCCVEGNHRILVYSYLENNSLAHTLLGSLSLLNPWYCFLVCYYFRKIKFLDIVTFLCLPCYRFRAQRHPIQLENSSKYLHRCCTGTGIPAWYCPPSHCSPRYQGEQYTSW